METIEVTRRGVGGNLGTVFGYAVKSAEDRGITTITSLTIEASGLPIGVRGDPSTWDYEVKGIGVDDAR